MGLTEAVADVWTQLSHGGVGFYLLVGGGGAALLALLLCPWPLLRGRTAVLLAPLLLTVTSVAGGVMVVERGRSMMIHAFRQPDLEAKVSGAAGGITLQLNGLAAIGIVLSWMLLLAALVIAVPWALRRRRDKQPMFAALATAFGLGGLTMVATQGLLRWALHAIHVFASLAGVDPSMKTEVAAVGLREGSAAVALTRSVLIYAAIVVMAAMALRAVRAARRGQVVGAPLLALSGVLFLVGGASFAATRAQAADEPLAADGYDPMGGDFPAPRVSRCGPGAVSMEEAPILSLDGDMRLNGTKMDGMGTLGEGLVTLWNNYRLLHPNGPPPEHPLLSVLADPKQPVAPFLEKWRALKSDYVLQLVARVPKPVETRTMGRIERFQICAYPLALGKGRKPPASFGELATAFSDQTFAIELP